MKFRALGESVVIRVDPPEDVMRRRADGVHDPNALQRTCSPPSTGVVTAIGDSFVLDLDDVPAEERHRTAMRFPKIEVGDHVIFSRFLHGQYVELVEEGIDYIIVPGISVIGVMEED